MNLADLCSPVDCRTSLLPVFFITQLRVNFVPRQFYLSQSQVLPQLHLLIALLHLAPFLLTKFRQRVMEFSTLIQYTEYLGVAVICCYWLIQCVLALSEGAGNSVLVIIERLLINQHATTVISHLSNGFLLHTLFALYTFKFIDGALSFSGCG